LNITNKNQGFFPDISVYPFARLKMLDYLCPENLDQNFEETIQYSGFASCYPSVYQDDGSAIGIC
jgi:hypothetical protein